jgi:hypothetical protein
MKKPPPKWVTASVGSKPVGQASEVAQSPQGQLEAPGSVQ